MQKKLLIPILVMLVLVIVLMVRGCGNKDASQGDKQDETQDVQTDTFDNTNTTGNDVRTELGTMTANESGGVDITVTADGLQTTYTYTDVAPDAWYADAVNYVVSTGVMSGDDTQHLFQPEYGVERSQFAVIVYRFAGGTPTERTQSSATSRTTSGIMNMSSGWSARDSWAATAGRLTRAAFYPASRRSSCSTVLRVSPQSAARSTTTPMRPKCRRAAGMP